jgi:hypothetical protein
MSDVVVTVIESTTAVTVSEQNVAVAVTETSVQVSASSAGVQGATGATGATGAQGSSGVISVTSPITNSGSSSSAVLGINQSLLSISQAQVTNLTTDLETKTKQAIAFAIGLS